MKLLFVYDGPIEMDENGQCYSTALTNNMFSRYDCISNSISIAIRVNHSNEDQLSGKYMPLSKDKYSIVECPNIASPDGIIFSRKKCYKILYDAISKVDALIIRLPSFIGNLAVEIANKQNKKYIIEMVGCPWDALWNYNLKGKIIAPYMKYKTKKATINAKYVLYVSNEFLQQRYPTKGITVSCSNVILDKIEDEALDKRIEYINQKKDSKKLIIGTLGAIDINYKGQQYVIRAIELLAKKGYKIEYQIVGSGDSSYLSSVAQKYKTEKYVKFVGPIKHDDVFSWIDSLDIYIQPSNQEGLCRSIIEAMSRGCPVIASDAGGNPELINNKYIFKKKKYKELASCIENMNLDEMIIEAKNNFNNSKKYDSKILKERRTKFYLDFEKSVNKK